jgi:hypothetical protein
MARRGDQQTAVVDGVAGQGADQVKDLQFSADGKHVVYVLAWKMPFWAAMTHRAVIDGEMGPPYFGVSGVTFSADGKHVAYLADRGSAQRDHIDCLVVLDGKEGKSYPHIASGTLCFNPASGQPAFVTGDGDPAVAVIDGAEDRAAQEIYFSPDGKHVATTTGSGRRCAIVVDGKARTYDGTMGHVSNVTFSPDGRHLAYTIGTYPDNKTFVVVDGNEGPLCDAVRDFQFGPDGTRFAYLARTGGLTEACVTDAGLEKGYLQAFDLMFSPDGKHVAYRALGTGGSVVVRDGKEEKTYFQIPDHALCFSPDGKRLAYWAMLPTGMAVVADGKEGKGYGNNGFAPGLAFSPEGKRLAYLATRQDSTGVVVVDGVEGPTCDRVLDAPVVFDGPDRFHVLAVRGSDLIRMEVAIRQAEPASRAAPPPATAPPAPESSPAPVAAPGAPPAPSPPRPAEPAAAAEEGKTVVARGGWSWWLLGLPVLGATVPCLLLVGIVRHWRHAKHASDAVVGVVAWSLDHATGPTEGLPLRADCHLSSSPYPGGIKHRCVQCRKTIKVPWARVGKRFRCPGCGTVQLAGD